MKENMRLKLIGITASIMMATLLFGCESGSKKPERKKMPELAAYDGFYDSGLNPGADQGETGFAAENITIETADGPQNFINIPLPDASADSLAMNLVNSVRPFALPLLSTWAKENKSGVLLDLSTHHNGASYEGNFTLRENGYFTIPVIICWDQASAYRLAEVKALVQTMPAINLNFISGDNPSLTEPGR
jgi:hypothetical protein